jgi:twinkle protein
MDEPGVAAAAECAPLFTPGRCRIAHLPLKDANEMLVAGRVDDLRSAIYEAKVYRPDGIVTLAEIRERVLAVPEQGRPWFIAAMNEKTFGRRPGDLHGLGGGTGCGKTDFFTQQIMFDIRDLELTVGVLMLEQGVGETGRRIAGKAAGKLFHVPDGSWTQGELEVAWGELEATNRLHLYDSWGAMDWPTVKSKMLYMIVSLGCQHLFLDHLTALAAAEDDERKALEKIMAEIASLAQAHNVVIHFISHLATPEGKSHEEGGRVMSKHFKGSRAIQFWCHGMWGLERNTQAEDHEERSTTTLRCLKDRFTGKATGETWRLGYDPIKGLLMDKDADLPF